MRLKTAEKISIKEAMDNLSVVASINMEAPPPMAIVDGVRLFTSLEDLPAGEVRWLSGEGPEILLHVLDLSYSVVNHHLQDLYDNPKMDWESKKSRKGIAAMMAIVGESAQKMNAYLTFRYEGLVKEAVEQRSSYRNLQRFYVERFSKKCIGGIEGKESWETSWHERNSLLEASGTELKDFEALLRDKEYELFFILQENGAPYLNYKLLQNLKLTVDFDIGTKSFEDDPFLKVKAMMDRDVQSAAHHILKTCSQEISQFFKGPKSIFKSDLGFCLSCAIMALFLASNPRHLLQRTETKICGNYFSDFHKFLRQGLNESNYQKWTTYGVGKADKHAQLQLDLIHKLAFAMVTRPCGVKQEAKGLIFRTIRRGFELQPKTNPSKGQSVWTDSLLADENFRTLLDKFPSGPLMKILDGFRFSEDSGTPLPFDPWFQGNLPVSEYEITKNKKKVLVLSFASPVIQNKINSLEINPEFKAFLRSIGPKFLNKKHLLINLQDRSSWQESARSREIENLQEGFEESLCVVTIAKNTEFYHQRNGYQELNDAKDFMASFKEQLTKSDNSDYYFPKVFDVKKVGKFADQMFPILHKFIFDSQAIMTRQMREDFIEIFYQILIVQIMETLKVDSVSFTCKDSVDTGAYQTGLFFGFLKALNGGLELKESMDYLRYLFYWKSLSVRERAADPEMFIRSVSALEAFSKGLNTHTSKLVDTLDIQWVI